MTFFNRKEEVINIELTQYGKYLLSVGKFKPAYYDFFDDDILYDIKYSGEQEEKQREIQDRIKDTLRTHTQYTFVGAEESIKKQIQQIRNKTGSFSDIYIPYAIKHKINTLPLGRSEIGQQKNAAWNIKLLNGIFEDTKTFITGTYSNLSYPRLTLKDSQFKITIKEEKNEEIYTPADKTDTVSETGFTPTSDLNNLSTRFTDGTYFQVESDYLLLDLKELNVPFEQENFQLELYSVEQDENGEEVLKQLFFSKIKDNIVNNVLVDTKDTLTDFRPNTTDMVETFFNIKADREIDSTILCTKLTNEEKAILVATNQLDIDCEEVYSALPNPRLNTNILDTGDKC